MRMTKAEERTLRQGDAEEPSGRRCCTGCERDIPAEGNTEGVACGVPLSGQCYFTLRFSLLHSLQGPDNLALVI